jgi:AcrR family transcriptional regulator
MQQRSEETRKAILSTALECFSATGYDATGVAGICAKAGVSKGAFYHHFPSKQSLFITLLEEWLASLDAQMTQRIAHGGSVPESLVQMAGLTRGVFADASGMLPMFLEFWTHANRDPEIRKAVVAPYRRYENLFASFIQQGIDEGSLQGENALTTARVIVALAIGILLQGLMDPQVAKWDEVAGNGMQLIMKGLSKR